MWIKTLIRPGACWPLLRFPSFIPSYQFLLLLLPTFPLHLASGMQLIRGQKCKPRPFPFFDLSPPPNPYPHTTSSYFHTSLLHDSAARRKPRHVLISRGQKHRVLVFRLRYLPFPHSIPPSLPPRPPPDLPASLCCRDVGFPNISLPFARNVDLASCCFSSSASSSHPSPERHLILCFLPTLQDHSATSA